MRRLQLGLVHLTSVVALGKRRTVLSFPSHRAGTMSTFAADVSTAAGRAADAADAVAVTPSMLGQLQASADLVPDELPLVSDVEPCCEVRRYVNLGLAVSNVDESTAFYGKIGFDFVKRTANGVSVVRNGGGLELHLCPCDKGIDDNKNFLMDYPSDKFPGHTHASWHVPNVESAKEYLTSQAIGISGERRHQDLLRSLFARDLDRTTLEFEKNNGDPSPAGVVTTRNEIGNPQCIDHIGVRVSRPDAAWTWYAEKLGFKHNVARYEANPDPLKNFPPWITRTSTGVDVNLIINANRDPEGTNVLWKDGLVRPGILWVTYGVDDLGAAESALTAKGVTCVPESKIASSHLACLGDKLVPTEGARSLFVQDDDLNLFRLVCV